MARISSYSDDQEINELDKLLGTDGSNISRETKQFPISALVNYMRVAIFDGLPTEASLPLTPGTIYRDTTDNSIKISV